MQIINKDLIRILAMDEIAGWHSDRMFTHEQSEDALHFHKSLPMYQETELKSLTAAAHSYGVRKILVKDESTRFGLKAFKGLGGSYAVFRLLCQRFKMNEDTAVFEDFQKKEIREKCKEIEFVTATDGNHGKGVAWASSIFGCKSHVFMPKGTVEARRKAIEDAGADTAVITDLNYDQVVDYAGKLAQEKGWILVQDTSWEGYEEVPCRIIEGYLTMAAETENQMKGDRPTHIFLQAGVGSMAGGIAAYYLNRYQEDPPRITIVEPETVACVYLSAEMADGKPHTVEGDPVTIMAGLNCGTPCSVIWPVLRDGVSFYTACADIITQKGMRAYANPLAGDPRIISGESGAVTYGLLLEILKDNELKSLWKMDDKSVILLINTEGATDPEGYDRIVKNE